MLSELDSRLNIIEGSVDDRTEEERGLKVCVCHLHIKSRVLYILFCVNVPFLAP